MPRAFARVAGVIVAAAAVVVVTGAAESATAQVPAAGAAAQGTQGGGRSYRATRRIVADRQTGQARMPTRLEVDELVASLTTLTHRPETVPEEAGAAAAITADLGGGFGGVMLARPNEDGTLETRCVFTFEEGAEFLGLVEVVQ